MCKWISTEELKCRVTENDLARRIGTMYALRLGSLAFFEQHLTWVPAHRLVEREGLLLVTGSGESGSQASIWSIL